MTYMSNPLLTALLQEKLDAAVSSPFGIPTKNTSPPAPAAKTGKDCPNSVSPSSSVSSPKSPNAPSNLPPSTPEDRPPTKPLKPNLSPKPKDSQPNVSYRDFSRVLPEKPSRASSVLAEASTAKEPTFPVKLHQILSNSEFSEVISWLPHGRSWRILQQKAFEERVIPLFFRHGRYSSFARQVNGWGFRRVTHGSDYNSYYHEMFLRGMPHLCEKMRRLTSKDSAARKNLEGEPAPDFYKISRANPLPKEPPLNRPAILPEVARLQRVAQLKDASWLLGAAQGVDNRHSSLLDRLQHITVAKTNAVGASPSGAAALSALRQAPLLGGGVLGSANPALSHLENSGLMNNGLLGAAGITLGHAPGPVAIAPIAGASNPNYALAGIYNAATGSTGYPALYGSVLPQLQMAASSSPVGQHQINAAAIANQQLRLIAAAQAQAQDRQISPRTA